MRKLAVVLSVLLVAALSVPAFAQLSTDISGKVGADFYHHLEDGPHAVGEAELNIGLSAGKDGAISAVLDVSAWSASTDGDFGSTPFEATFGSPEIKAAYVQTKGSWIKGTPETTTKIGRFGVNYSDWVGNFRTLNGLEISDIDLGLGGLALYWGRTGSNDDAWVDSGITDADVVAVNGGFDLDIIDVSVTLAQTNPVNQDPHTDFGVSAGLSPVDGLTVSGTYASDGDREESGYKVGAELATIPNFSVNVEHWSIGENFNPTWSSRDDDNATGDPDAYSINSKGFKVGASTEQAGINLGLTLTDESEFDGTNPVQTTEFTAGTSISNVALDATVTAKSTEDNAKIEASAATSLSDVNLKYSLAIDFDQSVSHTFDADTTVDTPIADGVNLAGKAVLEENEDAKLAASATWAAPNGFNLGVFWSNFDRVKDDYGWDDDYNMNAGLLFKAGIEVGF